MLMGTLLFVALGIEFDRYDDVVSSIVIVVIFYVSLRSGALAKRKSRYGQF
jgi:hypothetical protein